jgi:hypothetical protein
MKLRIAQSTNIEYRLSHLLSNMFWLLHILPLYLSSGVFWGFLLSVAAGLFYALTSLIMGAEPSFFTLNLLQRWFNISTFIFILSCSAEFLIFVVWLLIRLIKRDNQIYPISVIRVHAAAIWELCMALDKLCGSNRYV